MSPTRSPLSHPGGFALWTDELKLSYTLIYTFAIQWSNRWSICLPSGCRPDTIHKFNAVRRSDSHRTALRRWFKIGRCPSEFLQPSGRGQSDRLTETGRSLDDCETNVFIKIVRTSSSFTGHRPVTGQSADDEWTSSAMAQKLSDRRPIITFF